MADAKSKPRPRVIDAKLRKRIEAMVERLITTLDYAEPDPDLEENGDNDADVSEEEPSLGSVDNATNQQHWATGGVEDLEGDEHDGHEPDEDREPALGWTTGGAVGGDEDLEDDEDSGIADHDGLAELGGEPAIGSFDRMVNQEHAWRQLGDYCCRYHVDAEKDPAPGARPKVAEKPEPSNVRAIPAEQQAAALAKCGAF